MPATLEGKLTANTIRVPTPDVSMAIMLNLGRETTKEEINSFLRERATRGDLQQVWALVITKAVSSDLLAIVPVAASMVLLCKQQQSCFVLLYDNEFGYTCQVVRLMQALLGVSHLCPKAKVTAPPSVE